MRYAVLSIVLILEGLTFRQSADLNVALTSSIPAAPPGRNPLERSRLITGVDPISEFVEDLL